MVSMDPADRAVLDRLMSDDQVRGWLDAQRPRRPILAFLTDRDTWRTLLTAAVIPLVGWLALKGYDRFDAIWNRDAHKTADAQAKAIQAQSETRQDVTQVVALMPFLSGTREQRNLALRPLKTMAEMGADGHNPLSARMFESISALAQSNLSNVDPTVREGAVKDVELLSDPRPPAASPVQADAGKVQAASTAPLAHPSLAYIQIYGPAQRTQAQQLADALRQAGVPVPGIEDVAAAHPDTAFKYPQKGGGAVRYYRASDAGAAQFAADALGRVTGGSPQLRLLAMKTSRPGIVEIWLPCTLPQCQSARPAH